MLYWNEMPFTAKLWESEEPQPHTSLAVMMVSLHFITTLGISASDSFGEFTERKVQAQVLRVLCSCHG